MHYIKLRSMSPFSNTFVFVDVKGYLADQLFIKHMVRVNFMKDEAHRPGDEPYVIVFCTVRKKDTKRFLAALDELPETMRLHGHKDYMEYCKKSLGVLSATKEERK